MNTQRNQPDQTDLDRPDPDGEPIPPTRRREARVLAHLHQCGEQWGGALPLTTMSGHAWHAAIDALRRAGYTINTVTIASGDLAANEAGYVLRPTGPGSVA